MSAHQAFLSFNGGEVTPYLAFLNNFDKHASSCEIQENFLPLPFGGFRKRPGTIHLAQLPRNTRLEAFNFSAAEQYLLGFDSTGNTVLSREGEIIATNPQPIDDPFLLQFAQINDLVYIADPNDDPSQLSRIAPDTWTLGEIPFSTPPLLDENTIEEFTITTSFPDNSGATPWTVGVGYPTGSRVTYMGAYYVCNNPHPAAASGFNGPPGVGYYNSTVRTLSGRFWITQTIQKPLWTEIFLEGVSIPGQNVELVSSLDLFTADHVGAVFKISKMRALSGYSVGIDAVSGNNGASSTPLVVQGRWTFQTFGTWYGTFTISVSRDRGDNWEDIRSYVANGDRQATAEGEEPTRVLMRIRWNHAANGTSAPRAVLSAEGAFVSGLVKITAVADAKNATSVCLTPVESTTTQFWTEGAFSRAQGFPAAIGVHEARIVFGGTRLHPLSLWFSKSDDLINFTTGTDDDDSMFITLRASQQDPIRWIRSQRRLYIGTAGSEWVFGSENSDNPVTPTNQTVREHTNYGSAQLPAMNINDAVFFVERQGRRLREFAYSIERESYNAADLTRLAEHLTESGIVQLAFQANREPYIWAVRSDGVLLSFAYNRAEQIAAWSRHTFDGGLVRSVAVLRNESGDDEVFLTIQRGDTFHLEKFAAGQQLIQERNQLSQCHYVDSGIISATSGPNHEIALPPHMNGLAVISLGDGIYRTHTVSDNQISLPAAAAIVHVGFKIRSENKSLPLDIQVENGTTHSRKKQASELRINVFNSFGGAYVYNDESVVIDYTVTGDLLDSAPTLRTGWIEYTLPQGSVTDLTFSIVHDEPYPFLVRAAVLTWELHEP